MTRLPDNSVLKSHGLQDDLIFKNTTYIYMDTSDMYGLSSEKINESCLEDQDQPETRITAFVEIWAKLSSVCPKLL